MSGGIGFGGNAHETNKQNWKLISKKTAFQRIKGNTFLKESGKKRWKQSPGLIGNLIEIKKEMSHANRLPKMILSVFIILLLIFYVLFAAEIV